MTAFVRDLPTTNDLAYSTRGKQDIYRGNAQYMGEPDGPMRFVKSLGMEVPTFIDPRNDLKTQYRTAGAHKSVDYHVPPKFRGPYKPEQLADYDKGNHYAVRSETGMARCGGLRADGQICQKAAMNRTGFCSNHGGALHPADKLFVAERGIMPTDPGKLDRHQKVEMGIIPVSELTDEEIAKQQVKLDNGTFSQTTPMLSARIVNAMKAEFFARADRFVRENVMDMLEAMRDIATSGVSEDKDKIQAATWLIERAMGKTPDILLTNKTDTPFESMMGEVLGGKRDDYRNNPTPLHGGVPVIEGDNSNAITILDDEEDSDAVQQVALPGSIMDNGRTDVLEVRQEQNGQNGFGPSTANADPNAYMEGNTEAGHSDSNGADAAKGAALDPMALAKARAERKKQINRNRNRRYAAKSRGLNTTDDLPYEVVFKEVHLKSGTVTRMKLVSADDQKMR